MDVDEVVLNLKLISRVGKHQKLVTRDAFLNIETRSLIPESLRRWRRGDDRNNTLLKINHLVHMAIQLMPENTCMAQYLQEAVPGIENLKETYSSCSQTCARLDTVLDRIRNSMT